MRRMTRLKNSFSRKAENLACALALHFMFYNFIRKHQTLRMTAAMKAGIAKYPMTIEHIVEILPLPVTAGIPACQRST